MPDEIEQADCWTWITTIGELVPGFIGDTYLFGKLLDLLIDLGPDFLGLSTPGMVVGALIALLSAGGSAYAENVLNTIYQSKKTDKTPASSSQAKVLSSLEDAELGKPLMRAGAAAAVDPDSEETESLAKPAKPTASLSFWDGLALTGCGVSHAGYFAGNLSFLFNFVLGDQLSRGWKIGLQLAALVGGALTAYANVRTRYGAMKERAKQVEFASQGSRGLAGRP